jgi:hypothetical protein
MITSQSSQDVFQIVHSVIDRCKEVKNLKNLNLASSVFLAPGTDGFHDYDQSSFLNPCMNSSSLRLSRALLLFYSRVTIPLKQSGICQACYLTSPLIFHVFKRSHTPLILPYILPSIFKLWRENYEKCAKRFSQ